MQLTQMNDRFLKRRAAGRVVAGHPVDVASGVLFNTWEDVQIPGRMDLVWERRYSTGLLDQPPTVLGPGWRVNYLSTLQEEHDGYRFISPEGDEILFQAQPHTLESGVVVRDLGTFTELSWDAGRFLVTRWDPEWHDAERFAFHRRSNGQIWPLSSREDVTGQGLDIEYDQYGRLALIRQRREGRSLTLGYDPNGLVSTVDFVSSNERVTPLIRYEYDHRGRLVAAYDPLGYAQRYEYDEQNRLARETTRLGGVFQFAYDGQGRCIRASGLDDYNLRTFRYLDRVQWTEVTDSLGEKWLYQWRTSGQVETAMTPLGLKTLTKYDEHDRIVEKIGPKGDSTKFGYDEEGNRNQITDPLGQTVRFEYNSKHQLTSFVDASGGVWKLEYDARGNLVATQDAAGARWQARLNEYGEVIEAEDAIGGRMRLGYSSPGDLIEHSDWEGNLTRYTYDDFGRIVRKSDPLGHEWTFTYDGAGQLTAYTAPGGSRVRYAYDSDGNITSIIDANGSVMRYRYGSCGRLTEAVDGLGNTTRYRWSTEPNRLLEIVDSQSRSFHFEYDVQGRPISETDFEGVRRNRVYDEAGNCVRMSTAPDQEIVLEYDALHRLLRKRLPDGEEVSFDYDALGNVIAGKNSCCDVVLERDATGRVVKEKQGDFEVESHYDRVGNRVTRRTSLGHHVEFTYDHNCRLTGLQMNRRVILRIERDPLGREVLRRTSGGIEVRREYDWFGRLLGQSVQRSQQGRQYGRQQLSSTQETICQRSYSYDLAGNLLTMEDRRWGRSDYAYDAGGRLVRALRHGGASEIFQYDQAGNITRSARSNTRFDQARAGPPLELAGERWDYGPGNRLITKGNARFEYDEQGRLVRRIESNSQGSRVWEYAWNSEGWLAAVKCPDGPLWEYTYDAFGRRVCKKGPEGSLTFVWDGNDVAHEIPLGQLGTTWLFEPNGAEPVLKETGGRTYFSINDHLGMPRELIASDGTLAWAASFTSWGEVNALAVESTECPVRFPGQWWDEESGLSYNRFRHYDPAIARFTSPDPLGISGGDNFYQYVPNPTAWLDPFGLVTIPTRVGDRDYSYDLDSMGRTVRAEGPLCNPNTITNPQRDTAAQRTVAGGTGYHAGHLLGNQFGAPGGEENLVLMCPRTNLSSWKRMENQLARLTRSNKVYVVVNVHYDDDTPIPTKFTVTAQVTDRKGQTKTRRWTHTNCT